VPIVVQRESARHDTSERPPTKRRLATAGVSSGAVGMRDQYIILHSPPGFARTATLGDLPPRSFGSSAWGVLWTCDIQRNSIGSPQVVDDHRLVLVCRDDAFSYTFERGNKVSGRNVGVVGTESPGRAAGVYADIDQIVGFTSVHVRSSSIGQYSNGIRATRARICMAQPARNLLARRLPDLETPIVWGVILVWTFVLAAFMQLHG
jgi:hypothetical protein